MALQDDSKYDPATLGFAKVYPQAITILGSAARTTLQTQADQTNDCARGIIVVLDITAASGTGGLTLEIDGKDSASSGKYYALLTGTALTGTGTHVYRVFPGATASNNVTANDMLPQTWRVTVSVGDASSYTYSVGAVLLP